MLSGKNNFLLDALRVGLLSGVIAVFICLIGMVEAFDKRFVIEKVLTLGIFVLVATAVTAGYIISSRGEKRPYQNLISGFLAGLLVGTSVALFLILGDKINLRAVFINASPALYQIITYNKGVSVAWTLPLYGAICGLLGSILFVLPETIRRPTLRAVFFTIFMALFSNLFRVIMINQGGKFVNLAKSLFGQTGLTLSSTFIFFFAVLIISFFWSAKGESVQKQIQSIPKQGQIALRVVVFALLAYIVLELPQVSGGFISQVIVIISLYTLMGLGLNITLGFAGLLDLGFVALYAIGAYTVGLLTSYGPFGLYHLSFWLAVPIAVLVSMLAGFTLGLPVLGVRGDYLAIATLGFGEIVRILAGSDFLAKFFGGPQGVIGIQKPCIGTLGPFLKVDVPRICNGTEIGAYTKGFFAGPGGIYYIAIASALFIAFVAWRLRESRLGRAWMAIREDEDVAEALGINLIQTKLLAYMLGAAFAGLGGAIFTVLIGSIFASSMQLIVSINVVSLIIVGGMGSIPGVVVGAIALIGLPELLREVSDYRFLFYGIALIAMMLAKPEGLWPSKTTLRELKHVDIDVDVVPPTPTKKKKA